jgi:hypothetical protein
MHAYACIHEFHILAKSMFRRRNMQHAHRFVHQTHAHNLHLCRHKSKTCPAWRICVVYVYVPMVCVIHVCGSHTYILCGVCYDLRHSVDPNVLHKDTKQQSLFSTAEKSELTEMKTFYFVNF